MYKIQTPNGETFLTEKVTYVRQHSSGVYLITDRARAEGVNYHGKNYRYDDGTQVQEVDTGDIYMSIEEMAAAIREGVNEV
jgi:hypothetical protein